MATLQKEVSGKARLFAAAQAEIARLKSSLQVHASPETQETKGEACVLRSLFATYLSTERSKCCHGANFSRGMTKSAPRPVSQDSFRNQSPSFQRQFLV